MPSTPQSSSRPFGRRSKQSLLEICGGNPAQVAEQGTDRYRRTIGRVSCAGVEANDEQVRRGMAWVATRREDSLRCYEDRSSADMSYVPRSRRAAFRWIRVEVRAGDGLRRIPLDLSGLEPGHFEFLKEVKRLSPSTRVVFHAYEISIDSAHV